MTRSGEYTAVDRHDLVVERRDVDHLDLCSHNRNQHSSRMGSGEGLEMGEWGTGNVHSITGFLGLLAALVQLRNSAEMQVDV